MYYQRLETVRDEESGEDIELDKRFYLLE